MIKVGKLLTLICFLSNFIYISNVNTATINATSCSQSDVQAAINSARDGDIVVVPAGSCTWHSAVTFSKKGITIQGAGIDKTIITDATSSDWGQSPFWITGAEGKPFRITEFTFNGSSDNNGVIWIGGTCKNFRIDHCKFEDIKHKGIQIRGYTFGVIDHCAFIGALGSAIHVKDFFPGDAARLRPVALGTGNAVYIEDCTFVFASCQNSQTAIDVQSGGCFVFRHNIVNTTWIAAHGTDSGGDERGVYFLEIYENTISNPGPSWYTSILLRGGTGVIYNNTITGNFQQSIRLDNYRCHVYYPNRGYCNGFSPWDGNQEPNGYPCIDQIGRGQESSNPPPWGDQALDPLYVWGNTLNGVDVDAVVRSGAEEWIIEDRDFYNDTPRPGYTPYTYPHPLVLNPPLNLRFIK